MNRIIKIFSSWGIVALFCFLVQMQVFAQQPNFMFKANLSPDTILLGDRVELSISATVPKEYDVQFPFFTDSLIQGVEVIGKPRIDTIINKKEDIKELLYRLTVTSFDSGSHRIPGFNLPFSDGKTSDTVTTTPLLLMVNTLPPDTTVTSIYDIKPPIRQPYTFAEIAPWVGGGLLVAGLIALAILYYLRRKKNQPLFFPRKVQEPPHVIALRELEKLQEGNHWNTENHKHYHSVLTDIIRTYIEGRFQIPAMEQTTFEIIARFKHSDHISGKLLSELEQTLTLADLVKFAKLNSTVHENKESLEFGFRFVKDTMVAEEIQDNSDSKEEVNSQKPKQDKFIELPVEPINTQEQ